MKKKPFLRWSECLTFDLVVTTRLHRKYFKDGRQHVSPEVSSVYCHVNLCYCCICWLPTKSMPSAVRPRAISSTSAQGYGYHQAWCFFLVFVVVVVVVVVVVIANYLITTRKGFTVIFQSEG